MTSPDLDAAIPEAPGVEPCPLPMQPHHLETNELGETPGDQR